MMRAALAYANGIAGGVRRGVAVADPGRDDSTPRVRRRRGTASVGSGRRLAVGGHGAGRDRHGPGRVRGRGCLRRRGAAPGGAPLLGSSAARTGRRLFRQRRRSARRRWSSPGPRRSRRRPTSRPRCRWRPSRPTRRSCNPRWDWPNRSRADRGRGPPARGPRREPAAGPGRRAVRPGPAVVPRRSAGPRGAAGVRDGGAGRGDDRAQRRHRQSPRLGGRPGAGQQRQLPSRRHDDRARRAADRAGPGGAASANGGWATCGTPSSGIR